MKYQNHYQHSHTPWLFFCYDSWSSLKGATTFHVLIKTLRYFVTGCLGSLQMKMFLCGKTSQEQESGPQLQLNSKKLEILICKDFHVT